MINAGILTVTSLFLQLAGVAFNVYISRKIGADGMGLFQLIMSIYKFAVTFSLSGIGLTSTRLVAEELARKSDLGVKKAVIRCLLYAASFGTSAAVILLAFGEYLGTAVLGDPLTVPSIYIMAISMPFISMSCVLSGYFTAVRRVSKSAFVQISEQLFRMTVVIYLAELLAPKGLKYACVAITAGGAFSEILSFLLIFILYRFEKKRHTGKKISPTKNLTGKMLKIALPVGLSSYLRSGLNSIQQIMIPAGLSRHSGSRTGALAKYGIIQGMVMPVIMFASAFLIAFSNLIIPELAGCRLKNQQDRITYIVSNVFRVTLLFSICMSGIMLSLADVIAETVFGNTDAGIFIRLLAPLSVAMYLDNAVDGMLKGLDQQVFSMRYNIIDSAVSLILVCTLVPKFGINGYIFVIFVSELLNTSLSAARLIKVTDFKIHLTDWVLKPALAIAAASVAVRMLFGLFSGYTNLIIYIISSIVIYLLLLKLMKVQITLHTQTGEL